MSQIAEPVYHEHRAFIGGQVALFESAAEKFAALADDWEASGAGLSRVDYNHVAYHQVIGMGVVVVPLLLERLRQGDGDWVYALKCVTGEQAETPVMWGDADRVIGAWLAWGATRGFSRGVI